MIELAHRGELMRATAPLLRRLRRYWLAIAIEEAARANEREFERQQAGDTGEPFTKHLGEDINLRGFHYPLEPEHVDKVRNLADRARASVLDEDERAGYEHMLKQALDDHVAEVDRFPNPKENDEQTAV